MKLEHFLTPHTKINSKWIKDLYIRPETIKLLEENIGRTLYDINQSKILYDPPPRVTEIKRENKWDLIKLKSSAQQRKQPSEWEKIIASETTDKGLIYKIYKQLIQLNARKINNPIKKWGKDLNRHFSKEDIQMDNKHMKRYSTLLIIREIKTTVRYLLTPVRMSVIKSLQTINTGEGMEKREHSCTVGGNLNRYSYYGKQYGDSLKKLGIKSPYDPAIPLLGIYPKGTKTEKDTCILLFIGALFTIAGIWKQPRFPLTNEWIKKLWYIYTMEYYSAIKRNPVE